MIKCVSKVIMSLSPESLLCSSSRERCITNIKEMPTFVGDGNTKQNASVLVPLVVHNGDVCLLYTLRSLKLSSHSGQVSFPGGKMDKNENAFDTALRETEEEIGVSSKDVEIWTDMPRVQGRNTQVVITPVVGVIKNFDFDKLQPNIHEVAEIFTVPMRVLCDAKNHGHLMYNNIMIPVFMGGKHRVWGITGMITYLFLQSFLLPNDFNVNFTQKRFELEDLMPSKL